MRLAPVLSFLIPPRSFQVFRPRKKRGNDSRTNNVAGMVSAAFHLSEFYLLRPKAHHLELFLEARHVNSARGHLPNMHKRLKITGTPQHDEKEI